MACCGQKAHNSLVRKTSNVPQGKPSGSSSMQSPRAGRHAEMIDRMRIGRNK